MNFYSILPCTGYYMMVPTADYPPTLQYSYFPSAVEQNFQNYQTFLEGLQNEQIGFNQPAAVQDSGLDEKSERFEHDEHLQDVADPKLEKNEQNLRKVIRRQGRRKPDRNVLTNIGNQVFIFAQNRKRSGSILRRRFSFLSEQQVDSYYAFAKEVRISMNGYVNFSKLQEMWREEHPQNALYYSILRTLCYYYIRERLVPSILTSQKILPTNKPYHLKMRSRLLQFFVQQS